MSPFLLIFVAERQEEKLKNHSRDLSMVGSEFKFFCTLNQQFSHIPSLGLPLPMIVPPTPSLPVSRYINAYSVLDILYNNNTTVHLYSAITGSYEQDHGTFQKKDSHGLAQQTECHMR